MMSAKSWQVYLLLLARCVLQASRLAIGPLLVFIQMEMQFDTITKGRLLAAFPAGYLITQVLGGTMADRMGGKPVMTMSLIATSVCTALLTVAGGFGPQALWVVLFLEGVLQGPTFPTNAVILGQWITPRERSWANSMTEAGSPMGGLIAMGLTPVLSTAIGWRGACTVYSALSFLFALLWMGRAASTPRECTYISKGEMAELIETKVCDSEEDSLRKSLAKTKQLRGTSLLKSVFPSIPLKLVLSHQAIAVMLAHAIYNFGRYFLYFWMPSYFNESLGLPPRVAGFYLTLPELCGAVFTALGGYVASQIAKRDDVSVLDIRRLFSGVGFFGAGTAMAILAMTRGPLFATLALCMEGTLNAMHGSGFKANYQDLTTEHRGALSGIGNTVATLASTIGPLLTAELLSSYDSWPLNFGFISVVFFAGGVMYLTLAGASDLDKSHGHNNNNTNNNNNNDNNNNNNTPNSNNNDSASKSNNNSSNDEEKTPLIRSDLEAN